MFKVSLVYTLLIISSCSHHVTRGPASFIGNCHSALKSLMRTKSIPVEIEHDFHTTLGVEFEGMMSSHLSFRDIGELLKSHLAKQDPSATYDLDEKIYQTNGGGILRKIVVSAWKNGKEYAYTIKFDETLNPPLGKTGLEITSPVLRHQDDLDEFNDALAFLKMNQVDEFPHGGGIHVHYGLKNRPDLKKSYTLYKYMDQMHVSLMKVFNVDKSRMGYLERADLQVMIERLKVKLEKGPGHEEIDINYTEGLRSLVRFVPQFGTVEMRFFNSSMSNDHLNIYADFANRFFKAWEEENLELIQYFDTHQNADVLEVSRIIGASLELLQGH